MQHKQHERVLNGQSAGDAAGGGRATETGGGPVEGGSGPGDGLADTRDAEFEDLIKDEAGWVTGRQTVGAGRGTEAGSLEHWGGGIQAGVDGGQVGSATSSGDKGEQRRIWQRLGAGCRLAR